MARKTLYSKDFKACFHPSFSNSKTGGKKEKMMSIGYLSGGKLLYFKNGVLITDIIGTCQCVDCSKCSRKCYAIRTIRQYEKACINRLENTLQLRNDMKAHFEAIGKAIQDNKIEIVRYTESGELETYDQMLELYRLAIRFPNVHFYLYTKNYYVLRCFFDFRTLPDNMVVLISVWEDVGVNEWEEFKGYKNVKCFAVNSKLQPKVFCPAYKLVNGKAKLDKKVTCAKCGLCFNSKAKIIGCYEH